ncbi:MAG: RluA family pseudouridine synthase, partial [Oscillospiraceae bacterium]|nr:RluA family pseudouridine synthase [Oscillospiraceae bacterium]
MLVEPHQVGTRLDAFLAEHAGSRSAAARMIDDGRVTVNGRVERSSYRVRSGDEIVPDAPERLAVSAALPEAIPLAVVYEDADIIVIDKPKGMVVHPAPGHYSGTLVNALLHHCNGLLSNSGDPVRPGIVHRIDKDTSGLLIAAKHDFAHRELSRQLADRSLSRTYEAVIVGAFRESNGTIALPIGRNPRDRKKMAVVRTGGRSAVTHWSLIAAFRGYSHLRCELDTGR